MSMLPGYWADHEDTTPEEIAEQKKQWKETMVHKTRLVGANVYVAKELLKQGNWVGYAEVALDTKIFVVFSRYQYEQLITKVGMKLPSLAELEAWARDVSIA